jgi:CRISPR-associated protein Csx17
MSESDKTIDWSKTTFEGSRREQLRRWRALSLRQRLEALDRLSDLAGRFEQQKTGQAATTQPPQEGVHERAVRESSAGYGETADRDIELPGCAPEPRDPTKKQSGG